MSIHQLDQAVLRPTLPEDIDFEPFPSFPPSALSHLQVIREAVQIGN
jgi:hypothetical protein